MEPRDNFSHRGSTGEPDGPWGGSLAFQKMLLGPESSFGARLAEHPLTVASRASRHLAGLAGIEPASLSLPRAGNSSLLAFLQAERRSGDRLEMSTPRRVCANDCLPADLHAGILPRPRVHSLPSRTTHGRAGTFLTWRQGLGGIQSRACRIMKSYRDKMKPSEDLEWSFNSDSAHPK